MTSRFNPLHARLAPGFAGAGDTPPFRSQSRNSGRLLMGDDPDARWAWASGGARRAIRRSADGAGAPRRALFRRRRGRPQAGSGQFELIGLDACLMDHVEVMDALAPHACYAVFSQETEPALGVHTRRSCRVWRRILRRMAWRRPRRLSRCYIHQDQRIVDRQARDAWIGRGSLALGSASAVGWNRRPI